MEHFDIRRTQYTYFYGTRSFGLCVTMKLVVAISLALFSLKKIHFSRRSRVFANSEGREKRGKGGEKEGKEEKREGRRITVAVKLMMVLMRYL